MPSDELASTIDELARKLDDVSEEEIRSELQRYLDHGVPLHQAKKDIEQSLSSGTSTGGSGSPSEPVEKAIDEISVNDQSVNLTVKILSVSEREITARGEEKTIWSGMLGDETGALAYTAWRDVGLEEGSVVRIQNAYITEWRDDPQVNIGDYAEVEATDRNIEVPPATDRAEERDIGDLEDGMRSVTVEGRILSKSEREVTIQGEPSTLWEGEIADASGKIPYTAWHDHGFEEGDVLRIENGYVRSFRGIPQLNFGENANVAEQEDSAVPQASALADVEGPSVSTTEHTVQELAPGMSSVDVTGRVLSKSERTIQSNGEERTLWEGELADGTGRIPYTAWHDHGFDEGDVIRVDNGYVRSFRGLPQFNFGDNAAVTQQPDDALPPTSDLDTTHEITIGDLQAAQGAVGVHVEAVAIEIREGSGLILRCPECRRVLQERECRLHGTVDGLPDLRVKAVVDDGTGAVMAVFDRSATEALLGKSLDTCQEEAEDAMSREIIEDEVRELLLMERVALDGNATHDDYGTTFIVNGFSIRTLEDVEARAEARIEQVHALAEDLQEATA